MRILIIWDLCGIQLAHAAQVQAIQNGSNDYFYDGDDVGKEGCDQAACEEDDGRVEGGGDDADDGTSSAVDSDHSGCSIDSRGDKTTNTEIGASAKVQLSTAASFELTDWLISYVFGRDWQTEQEAVVKEKLRTSDLFMCQNAFSTPVADRPADDVRPMVVLQNYLYCLCVVDQIMGRNYLGHRGFDVCGFDEAAGLAAMSSVTANFAAGWLLSALLRHLFTF